VPTVEYEKDKTEVNRVRSALETERIERDRNLQALDDTVKKLEAQMKNSEVRSRLDGLLTDVRAIDGQLVAGGNELLTVASAKNYVRGEVNEEDVGEVKPEMKATLQVYAYRTRTFSPHVTAVQPAADPPTERYAIAPEPESPPDNLQRG